MLNIDISAMSIPELSEHLMEIENHKNTVIKAIEQRKKQDKKALTQELKDFAESRGFSWDELFSNKGAPAANKVGRGRYKSEPKYCNPDDSTQTWTGRGTRPRWFKDALARGVSADQMLIGQ